MTQSTGWCLSWVSMESTRRKASAIEEDSAVGAIGLVVTWASETDPERRSRIQARTVADDHL